jgi:very-short-patch-repair endonuclease
MVRSWSDVPLDRVVALADASAEAIGLSLEPLPDDAPAVVTYRPAVVTSSTSMITDVLDALDSVAVDLFPAWLPGAELIDGPGGTGTAAIRALAMRAAASTSDFGPFLADLAARSLEGQRRRDRGFFAPSEADAPGALRGRRPPTATFVDEVRAVGLARVVAASFDRSRTAVLVHVPDGLTPAAEASLVAACEWFVYHGRAGVWLTGSRLHDVDRICSVPAPVTATAADIADLGASAETATAEPPSVSYPALAGRPHPGSDAEKALEAALAERPWAAGRRWNQTHRFGPLANPVKLDLQWPAERCVVEVDGPEHHGPEKYEADRRRDVNLQLDGYAVLRFTNDQVYRDIESVLGQIERFIHIRRNGRAMDGGRSG